MINLEQLNTSEELILLPHQHEDMEYIALDDFRFGYFEQRSRISPNYVTRLFGD